MKEGEEGEQLCAVQAAASQGHTPEVCCAFLSWLSDIVLGPFGKYDSGLGLSACSPHPAVLLDMAAFSADVEHSSVRCMLFTQALLRGTSKQGVCTQTSTPPGGDIELESCQ